jgi:hypothetical protein
MAAVLPTLAPSLVVLLAVSPLWHLLVWPLFSSSAVARRLLLLLLLSLAMPHRTSLLWLRTRNILRAQEETALFLHRLPTPPTLLECPQTSRTTTNKDTILHWQPLTASLRDIPSPATAVTLHSLRPSRDNTHLSKDTTSKASIPLNTALGATEPLPRHLLLSSRPAQVPTRPVTRFRTVASSKMPRSCPLSTLLETRVTVRSSAKGLVNGILGVKGVSFFLRDGGIYKAGSILERVVEFQC